MHDKEKSNYASHHTFTSQGRTPCMPYATSYMNITHECCIFSCLGYVGGMPDHDIMSIDEGHIYILLHYGIPRQRLR